MDSKKWIGADLDGSLAVFHGWQGHHHIGEPVPLMLQRVKWWLESGYTVKIFTARANDPEAIPFVREWCKKYIGKELPITATKDYDMVELWDDKAVQIERNTGERIDGKISIVPGGELW